MSSAQKVIENSTFLGVKAVLFDFDGPLCNVFAKIFPQTVAHQVQETLGLSRRIDDPLDLLEFLAADDQQFLARAEDGVVAGEIAAVKSAPATPNGPECIFSCLEVGLKVGIVSNNSASSVSVFLEWNGLSGRVQAIVGRAYAQPWKMKPNPWPLRAALEVLAVEPNEAIMVGDSVSDIQAAQAAGVRIIALANKPRKQAVFAPFDVPIIENMGQFRRFVELNRKCA